MEKNIYATLDLTKSLSDFQAVVRKLLELNNASEWDGQILKKRGLLRWFYGGALKSQFYRKAQKLTAI